LFSPLRLNCGWGGEFSYITVIVAQWLELEKLEIGFDAVIIAHSNTLFLI
jgi:hypothetical protein